MARRLAAAVVLAGLVALSRADCSLYQTGDLSYCSSLIDEFVADRNYPAERLDSAAKLTAQMMCNQDWAAGAFVIGGEYGDGITDDEVCMNRGPTCRAIARSFACREAAGNKGGSYYTAMRDADRLDEFQLTSYERAPARIADELWRAELGGDCPGALDEPSPEECCAALVGCNTTTVRIGGFKATHSEFCSSVLWSDGATVICNPDGSARRLTDGAAMAEASTAALIAVAAAALTLWTHERA